MVSGPFDPINTMLFEVHVFWYAIMFCVGEN